MDEHTCTIDDCDKQRRGNGPWCYGHYMKNWRYGTPTPQHASRVENSPGDRFGTLVLVERIGARWLCSCDCGRTRMAAAGELNRTGSSSTCGWRPNHRSDTPTYAAVHGRLRNDLGSASKRQCADCTQQAHHWSYDHSADDEMHELIANTLVAYSADQSHYAPRCVPCHKRYDLGRLNSALRSDRLEAS